MVYAGMALAGPVPMEGIPQLPAALDGSQGSNRASGQICQIDADTDLAAIQCWLAEFEGSPHTLRQYRKEAERLLLWAIFQQGKPLSGLMREDFQAYQFFLGNPQPRSFWCGARAPRHSSHWRPFQGPLSPDSQRQAMIVVNALLSYLVEARYLSGNPLSLIRRRNKVLTPAAKDGRGPERFLDQDSWNHLKQYIADLPRSTGRERAVYERTQFLFHFLYLLAPRVSEVVSHAMKRVGRDSGKMRRMMT